jgi:serine/threonine protein kinase
MYESARAVKFLHNGGLSGFKLFHRDIQSANIYLTNDYNARLMDCGLARLLPIDNSTSMTAKVMNYFPDRQVFGTPGYMSPEYEQCADSSLYEAAYDVYSVGVVMMELILGCSINSRRSRGQTEDFDESRRCVEERQGNRFPNTLEELKKRRCVEERQGNRFPNTLEELKKQADACIQWNPKSLDLICKAALLCVTPTNLGSMTINDLVSQLSDAIHLNPE